MEQESEKGEITFLNPDLHELHSSANAGAEAARKYIREGLDSLRYFTETFEQYAERRGYMQRHNELVGRSPELAAQSGDKEYSSQDFAELESEKKQAEELIQGIKDTLSSEEMYKAFFESEAEELEKLERDFKQTLLKINPEKLQ